jgi:hypothetical protein
VEYDGQDIGGVAKILFHKCEYVNLKIVAYKLIKFNREGI